MTELYVGTDLIARRESMLDFKLSNIIRYIKSHKEIAYNTEIHIDFSRDRIYIIGDGSQYKIITEYLILKLYSKR